MADSLNTRARSELLPLAASPGVAGAPTEILHATPCNEVRANAAMWRTIDLWSDEAAPWEARIEWSGGNAGSRFALVTVSHTTRLSVYASSVRVIGKSRYTAAIRAWAAITDGLVGSENEYSVAGVLADQGSVDVPVPPFASYVRLELAVAADYATSTIQLLDGWSVIRNTTTGSLQPSPGLPVGDSRIVRITAAAGNWRVTFVLNI